GNDNIRRLVGPVEAGVEHLKSIFVKDTAIDSVCHGAPLGVGGISKLHNNIEEGDMVQISSLKGELIAIGTAEMNSHSIIESNKGKAVELERVIMDRNTYPSSWKNV
ncbi:MAG: PUA domain-containing protein, partial [Candidatus Aenigmatarchaeota archaeon]